MKMAQNCSATFCDSEYAKHAGVCEKEAFKALCTPGKVRDGIRIKVMDVVELNLVISGSRYEFTSMEFFMCGGFMFLLGILVAVVAMAVIRTQQVVPTSPTKDSGITYKSYKNRVGFNKQKQKFSTKKTLANAFFFSVFLATMPKCSS